MPIKFTDEVMLERGAWEFREKVKGEKLDEYRVNYANFMLDKDPLQAKELLTELHSLEIAAWLLDNMHLEYAPFTVYVIYTQFKEKYEHLFPQVMEKRNREAGVAGQECLRTYLDNQTELGKIAIERDKDPTRRPPTGLREGLNHWGGRVTKLGPDGKPVRSLKIEK